MSRSSSSSRRRSPTSAAIIWAQNRRIYTDGRAWPEQITPSFEGYSIGKWVDPDADGRYGALEVETRGLKGPRALDASGLPLHPDNETIVKERIFLDAGQPQSPA